MLLPLAQPNEFGLHRANKNLFITHVLVSPYGLYPSLQENIALVPKAYPLLAYGLLYHRWPFPRVIVLQTCGSATKYFVYLAFPTEIYFQEILLTMDFPAIDFISV